MPDDREKMYKKKLLHSNGKLLEFSQNTSQNMYTTST